MAGLLDEFVGITNGLNEHGIEYAVCGGWAMAVHGFLRATLDIDILILTEDLIDLEYLRGEIDESRYDD